MDIKKLVSKMTLEEKAAMCSGADFWNTKKVERLDIPSVQVSDGPHGLRTQGEGGGDHLGLNASIDAVCFPAACATACSFDREMMYDMGVTLAKECQAENVSVLLGPAVNIKRSPLCGRNFEYISEDPYVAGELSAAYIQGVQSQNVGTSIKHFAVNNQEHERMSGSSNVDERTLREIYLSAFETAIKKAQPWTVMCSYNRVNGVYASENSWLLTKVLREEWGFDGFVVSDWGAVNDRVEGIIAGLELEMPGGCWNDKKIIEAVQDGTLKEERLDRAVERILNIIYRYVNNKKEEVFDREADHRKAEKIAEESIVLLKNDGQALPLSSEEKVAFIGGFAEEPRYQGGGSSHINSHKVTSALSLAGEYGCIQYAEGFSAEEDQTDEQLFSQAMETAENADKIVVFAGLPDSFESEGYDRVHMHLPDCQNRLIERLLTLGKPVIVVLHNGSPVEMPWAGEVQGILEAYLGGEAVGKAEMEILYGKVNPSGKLAESFPHRLEDNPSFLNFPGTDKQVNYAEGVFVGYRYYDTKKMDVLFPFGHGLSYTTFAYSNLKINKEICRPGDTIKISVDVTNSGQREGREIVQLYVSDKTGTAIRPIHELKGFSTAVLKPGETKTVTMELDYRSFAWYDVGQKDWYAANGVYEIGIGKSSRDIVLEGKINIEGSREKFPVIDRNVMIGDLLACPITAGYVKGNLTKYLQKFSGGSEASEFDLLIENMIKYMPLRSLRSFAGMTNEQVDAIVADLEKLINASETNRG